MIEDTGCFCITLVVDYFKEGRSKSIFILFRAFTRKELNRTKKKISCKQLSSWKNT